MEVIDNRTKSEFIDFDAIKYGVPFEYDGNFFLLTNNSLIINDNFTNAVDLKSGILCKFGDMEKVRPVNASVVINESED